MGEVKQKDDKTFREYYMGLSPDEKLKLETVISKKCMKSPATVRQWGYSCRKPSALCQKLISEYLKKSVDDLFPKKEVANEEAC